MVKRNYSIDLIRITSMFFVLLLHNMVQGGILTNLKLVGTNWFVAWTIEGIAIVAVNLFAMITGYLSVGHSFNTKRIITIVLQTLFWSWVITIVLMLLGYDFSVKQLVLSFVPITGFWYVKAYIGMMILAPVIDIGISKISKISFERILICALFICVSIGWVGHFFLLDGYSSYWLIIMYLIGVYVKKFDGFEKLKIYMLVILYAFCLIGTVFLAKLMDIFGFSFQHAISYVSPFVVVQSIVFFCLLMRLSITNKVIQKVLLFLAPVSFGVYLIDTSNFFTMILKDLFAGLVSVNSIMFFIVVVVATVLMYIFFSMLDYVRLLLFQSKFFVKIIDSIDWICIHLVDMVRIFILRA